MQIQPPTNIRKGAKYIQKETIAENIWTPREIQELAKTMARKKPGTKKYDAGWREWGKRAVDAIRFHLTENLPHPADPNGFGELFFNLGTAADRGEMPSFADPGARAGYAIEFFCRSRMLSDIFLEKYNPSHAEDVYSAKFCNPQATDTERTCRILSLGGGPGYDFVGLVLADTFGTYGQTTTRIEGVVFDYEEGWQDLVEAMNTATQLALVNDNQSYVKWGGGCDITKSLSDPSNTACQAQVASSDLIICQYCVAENAKRLRDSDFAFFADLFEQASNDTTIVLTEVTPRIWPEFVDVLLQRPDGGQGFTVNFLRALRGSSGPQLLIQKREGATIGTEELAGCDGFRRLRELHERKVNRKGLQFHRLPKKVRGSKVPAGALARA